MQDSAEITVVIKAPNQKHVDHSVQCQCSWTVLQLKTHLAQTYPSKPSVDEQRLIYSGQLLADDARLGDFLRPHADRSSTHTVHLVCLPPAAAAAPAAEPAAPGLRHRRLQHAQAAAVVDPPAAAAGEAPLPQQYDLGRWAHLLQQQYNQQHAVMQQVYSQYWLQYAQMMQLNAGVMPMVWPQPMPAASAAVSAAAPAQGPPPFPPHPQQPPQAQPQDQILPQPPQQPGQNVRLNAQGGAVADDEDGVGPWDWLDWLHGFARLSVLFLAVYLYASVSRLVVVLLFGFVVYLYNQGWFQQDGGRGPAAAAAEPAHPQQQQQDQQGEGVQDQERQEDEQDRQEPDVRQHLHQVLDEMGITPPAAMERPHPITIACTFFRAFFASLVPDRIPQ